MKTVVTGSSGFIGSNLVDRLVQLGHEVSCLVRPSSKTGSANPNARQIPIDFSSPDSLDHSNALREADVVFHVGGVTKALTFEDFRAGNVEPTRLLLDTLKRVNPGLTRFVLVSSLAAAGPANALDTPLTEAFPAAPIEHYGRSKREAELLLDAAAAFPYTIIRPATVYGPRDVDFLQLFKHLRRGLGLYPGIRHNFMSTIHVHDLVEEMIRASCLSSTRNQTYFMTNEVAVSWPEIYQEIGRALNRKYWEISVPLEIVGLAGRLGDVYSKLTGRISVLNTNKIDMARPRYWICSSAKAIADFGFDPRIPLQRGLEDTLSWYEKAGWL